MDSSIIASLFLALLVIVTIEKASSKIVCQDIFEESLCDALFKFDRTQCQKEPWNSKCRKTCGRCEKECYNAESWMTCEHKKYYCDNIIVAHECSLTCGVLGCEEKTRRVYHMP